VADEENHGSRGAALPRRLLADGGLRNTCLYGRLAEDAA
jgi:hypothetical protein